MKTGAPPRTTRSSTAGAGGRCDMSAAAKSGTILHCRVFGACNSEVRHLDLPENIAKTPGDRTLDDMKALAPGTLLYFYFSAD